MLRQGNVNRATTLAFHPLLKCPAARRRHLQKEEGRKGGREEDWRLGTLHSAESEIFTTKTKKIPKKYPKKTRQKWCIFYSKGCITQKGGQSILQLTPDRVVKGAARNSV